MADPGGGEHLPIELPLDSSGSLEQELRRLLTLRPTFVELVAPKEDVLIMGIGGPYATVGFGTLDMQRQGRQIGALGTVDDTAPDIVEFDAGGTPSPVARGALVRAEELLIIAKHFFETGGLHPAFAWE